jgi:hypothetical protein
VGHEGQRLHDASRAAWSVAGAISLGIAGAKAMATAKPTMQMTKGVIKTAAKVFHPSFPLQASICTLIRNHFSLELFFEKPLRKG